MSALWLVRHGSTTWSDRGRFQGSAPIGLSADGVREAHQIGAHARQLGIARIWTSPLQRARATADIVAQYVRAPVAVVHALRELNYGAATGCTMAELRDSAPALAEAWADRPWQVRFGAAHGALPDIAAAIRPLLRARDDHDAARTLCVTHGHVIRVAMTLCHQPARLDFWRTDVPSASIWHVPPAPGDDALR
jgi:broad specificity phosphatase PhoE